MDNDTRYPGGKGQAGHAEWIVRRLPPHVFYCEPFAGKAAVYRAKPTALRTLLIDADPRVVDWWNRRGAPGATAIVGDGIRLVELAADLAVEDLVLYIDPPYLRETRRSQRPIYRREMTRADHVRLLEPLTRLRCPAAVSGYDSPLYREHLAGWHHETREVMTRGGPRLESLWCNYAPDPTPPGVAVEYSDLGADYRERENNAKLLRRWRAKFEGMRPLVRRAVLLELVDAEASTARTGGAGSRRRG